MVPFSVLDLAFITEGSTPADALRNTLDLAQHAEQWGYRRYWLAEHHNMVGIASAATAVVIGYVAAGTTRIHVGAGGIMLPNHAPLMIAGQFGTLESLYPGRIDLVQFQRTCWWSSSRCSHLKCWCTRSMSSLAVNGPSGSTIARLPCNQRGSIGLSQGLFPGNRHTRIRTPPVRFTVRLCSPTHARTAWLTCQAALSHTSTHTRLPSWASWWAAQARNSIVTRLTGRPSTKRSSTRS